MNDHLENLDRLLDEGLQSYIGQVPPPGMESRVLHRVQSGPRRWWIWLPAAVTVAFVCLALLVVANRPAAPVPRAAKQLTEPGNRCGGCVARACGCETRAAARACQTREARTGESGRTGIA